MSFGWHLLRYEMSQAPELVISLKLRAEWNSGICSYNRWSVEKPQCFLGLFIKSQHAFVQHARGEKSRRIHFRLACVTAASPFVGSTLVSCGADSGWGKGLLVPEASHSHTSQERNTNARTRIQSKAVAAAAALHFSSCLPGFGFSHSELSWPLSASKLPRF